MKVVVLLSGGIDSFVCASFLKFQGFELIGLHISFGQPASIQEEAAAAAIASWLKIELRTFSCSPFAEPNDSVVLGRNGFFILTALGFFDIQSGGIALGIHSGTQYFDCGKQFINVMQSIIDGYCSGEVQIMAPLAAWTKSEIIDYSRRVALPLELT